jgi:hypothetical protein
LPDQAGPIWSWRRQSDTEGGPPAFRHVWQHTPTRPLFD